MKESSYKIFLIEIEKNSFKIFFKFNSLIKEQNFDLFYDLINKQNNKEKVETKKNKLFQLLIDFITFPIYLIFETLIILLLSINNM